MSVSLGELRVQGVGLVSKAHCHWVGRKAWGGAHQPDWGPHTRGDARVLDVVVEVSSFVDTVVVPTQPVGRGVAA